MRRAAIVGAGSIGRGFLGQLAFQAGWTPVFIDASASLVERLNREGAYRIRLVDDAGEDEIRVDRFEAHVAGSPESLLALSQADFAATAVGAGHLPNVARLLARALEMRWEASPERPLDILLAENLHHAAQHMRQWVAEGIAANHRDRLDRLAGFVEASIGRMVPWQKPDDPLRIDVEPFAELPVDAEAFKGAPPDWPGLQPRADFEAYVARKLYMHNGGHAVAAYLAAERGLATIPDAMNDPEVLAEVKAAMGGAALALSRRFGHDLAELNAHKEDLMRRFGNRALGDTVARVAADPHRKLQPEDRLLGAARLCREEGIDAGPWQRAIAAALRHAGLPAAPDALAAAAGVSVEEASLCLPAI